MSAPACRVDRRLVGAVALSTAASGAGVALMAASAWLLSRAAEHPPVLFLIVAIVGVRFFGLSRGVFRYAERLVGHDVALRRQSALRVRVFEALADGTWVGRRGGDLLSRVVNDVAAVQDRVVRVVVPVTAAALVAVGTAVALTVVWPPAGLLVAAATVLGAGVVPVLAARLSARADRSLAPLRGALAEAVTEAHAAAPDLWAYGAAGPLLARVLDADDALRRAEQRTAAVTGWAGAAQLLTTGAAVVAGLLAAAVGVAEGGLAPVQVAVLALTPLALHEVVAGLPAALGVRTRTRAALARVDELLDRAPVGGGAAPVTAGAGAVDLHDVTVGWPGGPDLVEHLDLHVRAGERVALVGPSGSGKTTVAATVLGLLPPRAGTVGVSGGVGYLAQDAHLFDTTVAENLRIGRRDADDAACAAALARVGLDLPLDRLVGEHGSRLSGGEAQRVALARLLLREDAVVLLDEPTEHLDAPTADALVEDLLAATAGAAVLVITHDPTLVARCDRVVTLGPARVPVG
ncbi:thiol reductant ABC exporter subunit CydC [Microlunatus capsulatus]|uniref:thiol reductant ABC exporter subunit CydC n=1 Tax=Microlunatus capsulatus TaxID=99117 RepID=UPI0031E4052F